MEQGRPSVLVSTAIQALTTSNFRSALAASGLLNRIGFNLKAKLSARTLQIRVLCLICALSVQPRLLTFLGISSMALIRDTTSNFIVFYCSITQFTNIFNAKIVVCSALRNVEGIEY